MPRSEEIRRARQRYRVLKAVERRPVTGFTCDEIEQRLGLLHQTASARIVELRQCGQIWQTMRTRPTRTGHRARVLLPIRQSGVGRPKSK